MSTITKPLLSTFTTLSFDVYGTLIDWESGLFNSLTPLLTRLPSPPSRTSVLSLYATHEAAVQSSNPALRYSDVLAEVYPLLAKEWGLDKEIGSEEMRREAGEFGRGIGRWPAFGDTVGALRRLKRRGTKLVILSNVDEESIRETVRNNLSSEEEGETPLFDAILTAERIGSYKPDLRNFRFLLRYLEENELLPQGEEGKEKLLHVAQSRFHDHGPAGAMGLWSCWIDRANAVIGTEGGDGYKWRFETLGEFVDAVERGE